MVLNNDIDNPVAGVIWLGTAFVGTFVLNTIGRQDRRKVGSTWRYFFGPEPGCRGSGGYASSQYSCVEFHGCVARNVPHPGLAILKVTSGLPNQRMKLSWRGGRLKENGSFLIAAAAPRSLCASR